MNDANFDELIRLMQADELEDARLITPVEYGKLRGIAPQLVYYYIRSHKLEVERCECGRRCIEREEADKLFRKTGKLPPLSEEAASEASESDDGEPSTP
jgi:hypothetical protein